MTLAWKELADGQLPNAKTTLYTVPASTTGMVARITLVNTDASAITVNLYKKKSAGTSRRLIGKDVSLAAAGDVAQRDRFAFEGPLTLEAGAVIEGDAATAAKIDYTVSGVERTGSAAGGSGTSAAGQDMLVAVEFMPVAVAPSSYTGTTDEARMFMVRITAPMKLNGLRVYVVANGTGTHEWGLFDASVDPTACVKIAGGSSALNSGGSTWQDIPATGAPVDVPAGTYLLIFKWPAANEAQLGYTGSGAGPPTVGRTFRAAGVPTPYTWDDTPNVTIAFGWADDTSIFHMALHGDSDAGGVDSWW